MVDHDVLKDIRYFSPPFSVILNNSVANRLVYYGLRAVTMFSEGLLRSGYLRGEQTVEIRTFIIGDSRSQDVEKSEITNRNPGLGDLLKCRVPGKPVRCDQIQIDRTAIINRFAVVPEFDKRHPNEATRYCDSKVNVIT
ncbi:MAG: hypothetical protein F4034_11040 [Chloroflexi bacterium]|nr:hypothetical protein [Chloroflexota bacterium]